ncbi:class I SAM-dependent methyltransferase [Streptomyces sporangiiformans]|uniref:Class I SAM-dependent methyltransferase n=1 Tax=Streptomyces sporangiiformans TaxID=2315329 RepID=A0A505DHH2_9ACTN|nr:class I SAM-dependent methyltransferase [Streptomyces sporangiiformans]
MNPDEERATVTAELTDHETPDQSESGDAAASPDQGPPAWLAALRAELDPHSKRRLEALEPKPDWRCLEIGAGSGSIARWLAERCPSGKVVATDIELSSLGEAGVPNLEIVRHDVTTDDFPEGSFDLIYARYVFSHLRSRESDLARVASWLAPGGWLLLEEPAKFPIESARDAAYREVSLATLEIYKEQVGTDLDWPRSFPAPLVELGLEDIGMDGSLSVVGGNRAMGLFWGEAIKGWGPTVVAAGKATEEQIEQAAGRMYQDDFWDLGLATAAAWGRRPA